MLTALVEFMHEFYDMRVKILQEILTWPGCFEVPDVFQREKVVDIREGVGRQT